MAGRFYEEWKDRRPIEHEIRRTVTETDNLLITTLTHNAQPLHLDAEAEARDVNSVQILVNGIFTFGLMVGGVGVGHHAGRIDRNLGYDELRMPKPVFIGDTLRGETTVAELRESKSRPQGGIVTFAHRMPESAGRDRLPVPAHGPDPTAVRMKLRSLLFVPGDRPDQMQKALAAGADALILDLEDSVAPQRKPVARQHVAEFLAARAAPPAVFVRVNPLSSGLTDQDLAAIASGSLDGVVLPKGGRGAIDPGPRRADAGLVRALLQDPPHRDGNSPGRLPPCTNSRRVADRLAGVTWGRGKICPRPSARHPPATSRAVSHLRTKSRARSHCSPRMRPMPQPSRLSTRRFETATDLLHYARRGARDGFHRHDGHTSVPGAHHQRGVYSVGAGRRLGAPGRRGIRHPPGCRRG